MQQSGMVQVPPCVDNDRADKAFGIAGRLPLREGGGRMLGCYNTFIVNLAEIAC